MRSPLTTFAKVLLATAAFLSIPASARAQSASLSCPTTATGSFVAEVRFDAGATPLGAYSMTLTFPSAVLSIASGGAVAGGDPAVPMLSDGSPNPFSSRPTVVNLTTPGSARISAFQTASLTEPTGVVSAAKITFTVLATNPAAMISLSAALTDASTSQTFATVTGGCSVSVTALPGTTTTSSTTTSSTTTAAPTTSTSSTTTTAAPTTTTSSTAAPTTTTSSTTTTRASTTTTSSTAVPTTTTSSTTTVASSTTTSSTAAPTTTTSSTTTPPTTTTSSTAAATTTTSSTTTTRASTTTTSSTAVPTTTTSSTTAAPTTTTSSTSAPTTTTSSTTSTRAPTTTSSTTTTRPTSTTTSTQRTTTTSSTTTTTTLPTPGLDCTGAFAVPDQLWPPNHKFVEVSVAGVTGGVGTLAITITGITQDEPVLGSGSGRTCPDGAGVGTDTALLRAERNGFSNGRVYRISFQAEDPRSAQCQGTVTVCVPMTSAVDATCIDDGAVFDSAACAGSCSGICAMEQSLAAASCPSVDVVPAGVSRRVATAIRAVQRAANTRRKATAQRLVRRALHLLRKANASAGHAGKASAISPTCAEALSSSLEEAQVRGEVWLGGR